MFLSKLKESEKIMVGEEIYSKENLILSLKLGEFKANQKFYQTTETKLKLNAKEVISDAIENIYCNDGYEDWDELILSDFTEKDYAEIQFILDKVFNRCKTQNISYYRSNEIILDDEYKKYLIK